VPVGVALPVAVRVEAVDPVDMRDVTDDVVLAVLSVTASPTALGVGRPVLSVTGVCVFESLSFEFGLDDMRECDSCRVSPRNRVCGLVSLGTICRCGTTVLVD